MRDIYEQLNNQIRDLRGGITRDYTADREKLAQQFEAVSELLKGLYEYDMRHDDSCVTIEHPTLTDSEGNLYPCDCGKVRVEEAITQLLRASGLNHA